MDDLLLVIICSPSGAGKSTLTRLLLDQFSDLTFSVSHTTRPPRVGEASGREYRFVDRAAFAGMIARGEFAEWAEVHGNLYGTSMAEMDRARAEGRTGILFDIDYQGARQIKARLREAVGVFILPPSIAELERRLRTRASDSDEQIRARFQNARLEIEHYNAFDYVVVNDSLESAHSELAAIVSSERARWWRRAPRAEMLLHEASRV